MASNLAIIDTSIFIDYLRSGLHQELISSLSYVVRNSAVVLAELGRGAKTRAERHFLEQLAANYPIWVPTRNHWLESGLIINKIRQAHGFEALKLRDMHFDVLIALTARSYGARVLTSNRTDFETIACYLKFELEVCSSF